MDIARIMFYFIMAGQCVVMLLGGWLVLAGESLSVQVGGFLLTLCNGILCRYNYRILTNLE